MASASVTSTCPARFYPIVPDAVWVARIAPLGIGTVQLRLKDASAPDVSRQIGDSLAVCRAHGVQLIVNDHWREAIALGAAFVHLGQEDLAAADVAAIRAAGLQLGVSTHDEAELETALAVDPDYIALGPVYETTLKAMKWAPQGLDRVAQWRSLMTADAERKGRHAPPLVAIGGLTPERAPAVFAAGAQSVAVITDFLIHARPEQRIAEWVALARS